MYKTKNFAQKDWEQLEKAHPDLLEEIQGAKSAIVDNMPYEGIESDLQEIDALLVDALAKLNSGALPSMAAKSEYDTWAEKVNLEKRVLVSLSLTEEKAFNKFEKAHTRAENTVNSANLSKNETYIGAVEWIGTQYSKKGTLTPKLTKLLNDIYSKINIGGSLLLNYDTWEALVNEASPREVTLTKSQMKQYDKNEDMNYHTENIVLLAKASDSEVLYDAALFCKKQLAIDGHAASKNRDLQHLISSKILLNDDSREDEGTHGEFVQDPNIVERKEDLIRDKRLLEIRLAIKGLNRLAFKVSEIRQAEIELALKGLQRLEKKYL